MILLRSIGIFILIVFVNSQSVCKTSVGEAGICIPVKECNVIVNILTQSPKPLSQKSLDYLKINYCGLQNSIHYICCSERHLQNSTSTPPVVFVENSYSEMIENENEESINVEINNVTDHPNLNLLPLSKCGNINFDKILAFYGNRTLIGEFPWMAMLQYQTPEGLEFQCGGTLISSRYVLTAAYCATKDDVLISVRLGEYNTSSELDCEVLEIEPNTYCADPVQDIEVEEIIYHPQYDNDHIANDIALIRLKREVNLTTDFILPICLPVTAALQRQKLDKAIITGWGLTEYKQTSDSLLRATLPVISNDQCQEVYQQFEINNSYICVGGENIADSCKGDFGGPLIFPGKISNLQYTTQYVQFGITSAETSSCGSPSNLPSVYTKVAFYIEWILDQLKP